MGFPKVCAGVAMTRARIKPKSKAWLPPLIVAVVLAIAPALFNSANSFFSWIGIVEIVPMTVGEYSTYLGTIAAIIWAVYTFAKERDESERRAADQKGNERPKLDIVLHGGGAITIQNAGAYDAICVSNCDIPLVGRLHPGETIDLIWLEAADYEELVSRYEGAIPINDYVISSTSGIDINIFAYSIHGVLWSYECDLSFDGQSRIVVSESWS